jgi:hypothetical protein
MMYLKTVATENHRLARETWHTDSEGMRDERKPRQFKVLSHPSSFIPF